MLLPFTPRPHQRDILAYHGGRLGISAVPGAGKTHTLSALAAQLIAEGRLDDEQEVLIVTLVNSAVDNFLERIKSFIDARGLIGYLGYRVRTLHGLANDIVRENPSLVGLETRFEIVDEITARSLLDDAANAWGRSHPDSLNEFLKPDVSEQTLAKLTRDDWPRLVTQVAGSFIETAKNRRLSPRDVRARLDETNLPLSLAEMGCEVYENYQRALQYRGAVDFTDLIRLAGDMLDASPELLERLRYRWPYILEDEAQDSSALQEQILDKLAGPADAAGRGWVRVGDPNQAVYETFTTADPALLRRFRERYLARDLPTSGRSQPAVLELANHLIDWTQAEHPLPAVRDALTPPHIEPTAPDDPQPNPPDDPAGIHLIGKKYTSDEEIAGVAESLERWLPDHQDETVAVLTATNDHAARLTEELKKRGISYIELLRSTSKTRSTAGAVGHILAYLSEPQNPTRLARTYQVWRRDWRADDRRPLYERVSELLRKCRRPESFLAPQPGGDFVETLSGTEPDAVLDELYVFRPVLRRWMEAALLPIDQLILTLGQEIFSEPADLALAHKLALVLRQAHESHNEWRLPELTAELITIARNERRFLGFSQEDSFDPSGHKGTVVVATLHKAKGLEWDRVYLMSVNNYDFPSGQPNDRYISERWFVRDSLNLEAEAIAQFESLMGTSEYEWYEEGRATREARLDYVRERLRLFYVGMTRAKKELVVTWNTGRFGEQTQSLPFAALQGWWEEQV